MKIDYDNDEVESFIKYGLALNRPYTRWKSNQTLRRDIDKVMRILTTVDDCSSLYNYKSLNYEPLKYAMAGKSSVRLGFKTKFRLIFTELEDGIRINIIEISEHYGDK